MAKRKQPLITDAEMVARYLAGENRRDLALAAGLGYKAFLKRMSQRTGRRERLDSAAVARAGGPGSPSAAVRADGDRIVARLLGDSTVEREAAAYGTSFTAVYNLYVSRTTAGQRREAKLRKVSAWVKAHPIPQPSMERRVIPTNGPRFRPGEIRAGAARRWLAPGCVTLHKVRGRPYRQVKTEDGRWVYLSRFVWEAARGPIPAGHVVTFRDRDTLNDSLGNLECVPRRELLRRAVSSPKVQQKRERRSHAGVVARWEAIRAARLVVPADAMRPAASAPAPTPLTPREKARANIERLLREEAA